MTNIFLDAETLIKSALTAMSSAGELPGELDLTRVTVEPPRDPSHGDVSTNAAMLLAKQAKSKPRDIADKLVAHLADNPMITTAEVAGPGFVNLRLLRDQWVEQLRHILRAGETYGQSQALTGQNINVEYVSANPTGPLHAAHARGAVVGDALSVLLAKAGAKVTREYYINDAGNQVNILGRSTFLRYREALGETIDGIPEGMYPGEYLKDVGAALAARDGDRWVNSDEAEWLPAMRDFAITFLMAE
ncbi:MAG: arginine--tRNA ligase, partial [Pseudomonadota bacterium]